MKRLIIIATLLFVIFAFRENLNMYAITFFGQQESNKGWVRTKGEKLYGQIPKMDLAIAIIELGDFEKSLQAELESINNLDSEQGRILRRNLVCELTVVYKKMAQLYLQDGNLDAYYEYVGKSNTQLEECADLRSEIKDGK